MHPYSAEWIKSYRDFPLMLNRWNSVVRWEFKNPLPSRYTREFPWQEGHTTQLTKAEADADPRPVPEHLRGAPCCINDPRRGIGGDVLKDFKRIASVPSVPIQAADADHEQ